MSAAATVRAVAITQPGDVGVLQVIERPVRDASDDEVPERAAEGQLAMDTGGLRGRVVIVC